MSNKSKNIQKADTGNIEQSLIEQEERGAPHFENLARISSTLLGAIMALLTFFLVVGAQSSIKGFSGPLYVAIVLLGASLIVYAVSYRVREYYYVAVANSANNEGTTRQQKRRVLAAKLLKGMRILQQLVFIASIGAVVWFAITYAQLFLNPKPIQRQQPASSQQGAPAPGGSQGPASGETPEEHAKETQQTPATP